ARGRAPSAPGDSQTQSRQRAQRALDQAAHGTNPGPVRDGRAGFRGDVVEMTKWKYFIGSCILAGGLLIKLGAPIVPVVTGIAVAAAVTWRAQRRPNGASR